MSLPSTQPTFVTLHRLGELSGKSRGTLLLRMRDGELLPDAHLDLGGRLHPLFVATRTSDLKRMPTSQAHAVAQGRARREPDALNPNPNPPCTTNS